MDSVTSETAPAAGKPTRPDTPIVLGMEVDSLLGQLARLKDRRATVLYADIFPDDSEWDLEEFEQRLRYFLLLTAILLYKSALPVVKIINLVTPPDAHRQELRETVAKRANLLRAYTRGGFADLNNIRRWIPELDATSAEGRDLGEIVLRIQDTLDFIAACLGGTGAIEHIANAEAFFALSAEAAMAIDPAHADTTTHAAHVLTADLAALRDNAALKDFLRSVQNPLLVRVDGADGLVPALEGLAGAGGQPRVILDVVRRAPDVVAPAVAAQRALPDTVCALISTFDGVPVAVEEGRTDLRVGNREVDAFCADGSAWAGVGLAAGGGQGDFRLTARNRMPSFAYHLIEMLNRSALPMSKRGLLG